MQLSEIKMSPSSLKTSGARVNALIGIEYEFVAIGYNLELADDSTPDYHVNPRPKTLDEIKDFFLQNSMNSQSETNEVIRRIYSEYMQRKEEMFDDLEWEDSSESLILKYLIKVDYRDEILEKITSILRDEGVPDRELVSIQKYIDHIDDVLLRNTRGKNLSSQERRWFYSFADAWNKIEDEYVNRARDIFDNVDEHQDVVEAARLQGIEQSDVITLEDFLGLEYPIMTDVMEQHGLEWPIYTQSREMEELTDDFSSSLGSVLSKPISKIRTGNEYTIVADSSVEGDHRYLLESGIELISPPLSISDTIKDFTAIKKWLSGNNHYTNKSTGLHVNISIPGKSMRDLDYIKLVLLLGDRYILERFGRQANSYAKSSLDVISNIANVETSTGNIERAFQLMKKNMMTDAGKLIKMSTEKYSSVRIHPNRVEFRGIGGDWLTESTETIMNTIYRMVVVLDAALDPNKHVREYQSKLYQLLSSGIRIEKRSLIPHFVKYSTGELSKVSIKSLLKTKHDLNILNKKLSDKKFFMMANVDDGYAWDSVEEENLDRLEQDARENFEHWVRVSFSDERWDDERKNLQIVPTDYRTHRLLQQEGEVSIIFDVNKKIYRAP